LVIAQKREIVEKITQFIPTSNYPNSPQMQRENKKGGQQGHPLEAK
jgi:hypothetical protein